MDTLCDPEAWYNPKTSINPNIIIHRAIGLHPKYNISTECLTELQQALSKLIKYYDFQAYGLIGTEVINDTLKGLTILNASVDVFKKMPKPVILHSRKSDNYCITAIDTIQDFQYQPIIWHGINIGEQRLCGDKQFLDQHFTNYFSVNNLEAESNRMTKLINTILNQPNGPERIFTESDCPNNPPKKAKQATSTPLNVISATIAVHKILKKKQAFQHFTLADTNELLFTNACNAFRIDLSKKPANIQEYTFKAQSLMKPILEKWKGKMEYINPRIVPNKENQKTTNTETQPKPQ